jgi:hypothetical protein
MNRVFLGRRWQVSRASDAKGSTSSATERGERRIAQPAASGVGGAGLRPAGADDGEVRV